jgi:hypothetical protein
MLPARSSESCVCSRLRPRSIEVVRALVAVLQDGEASNRPHLAGQFETAVQDAERDITGPRRYDQTAWETRDDGTKVWRGKVPTGFTGEGNTVITEAESESEAVRQTPRRRLCRRCRRMR